MTRVDLARHHAVQQNARMLNYLLAKYGIPFIEPAQFGQLPHYLAERGAVIFFGMPPYSFWHENPPRVSRPTALTQVPIWSAKCLALGR